MDAINIYSEMMKAVEGQDKKQAMIAAQFALRKIEDDFYREQNEADLKRYAANQLACAPSAALTRGIGSLAQQGILSGHGAAMPPDVSNQVPDASLPVEAPQAAS